MALRDLDLNEGDLDGFTVTDDLGTLGFADLDSEPDEGDLLLAADLWGEVDDIAEFDDEAGYDGEGTFDV